VQIQLRQQLTHLLTLPLEQRQDAALEAFAQATDPGTPLSESAGTLEDAEEAVRRKQGSLAKLFLFVAVVKMGLMKRGRRIGSQEGAHSLLKSARNFSHASQCFVGQPSE
jgi:hypothetical protein